MNNSQDLRIKKKSATPPHFPSSQDLNFLPVIFPSHIFFFVHFNLNLVPSSLPSTALGIVPYLFEFSGKSFLSSDYYCDVILLFDDFDVGSWDFVLDLDAAADWENLIVSSMDHRDAASEMVSDCIQVTLDFVRTATYDVVQGVPCCIVRVAEKTLQQERLQPIFECKLSYFKFLPTAINNKHCKEFWFKTIYNLIE